MFARATKFKMKAEVVDAALAKLEEIKPRIIGLDGLHQVMNVMAGGGVRLHHFRRRKP